MKIETAQILVTGASGSLGRQLLYILTQQGIRPIAHMRAGSNSAYADSLGLPKRLADLRNEAELAKLVAGVDCIIHTAAWVNFRQDRLTQFTGLNTFGAVNLYRAAREAGVGRLVQVSSVAAIGGRERNAPGNTGTKLMTEDHTFNLGHLQIPYILTKRAAEDELLKLWQQGGPELVIVNPSIIIAPSRSGDDRTKATKLFGRPFLPRLPNVVPLVDMRDVAPAIVAALGKGRPGERYILTGENIAAEELVRMAGEILGACPKLVAVPRWLLNSAASISAGYGRFAGKAKISFYPDLVRMLDYDWGFSSEKARAELGFAPRPLRSTLTDLLTNSFIGTWQKP